MERIHITDVAPRDGLQNQSVHVPTAGKLALIRLLAAAGVQSVEATSFVSPKAVPQMADAADLVSQLNAALPRLRSSALVQATEVSAQTLAEAQRLGLRTRAYVAVAFDCPFEGATPLAQVVRLAAR